MLLMMNRFGRCFSNKNHNNGQTKTFYLHKPQQFNQHILFYNHTNSSLFHSRLFQNSYDHRKISAVARPLNKRVKSVKEKPQNQNKILYPKYLKEEIILKNNRILYLQKKIRKLEIKIERYRKLGLVNLLKSGLAEVSNLKEQVTYLKKELLEKEDKVKTLKDQSSTQQSLLEELTEKVKTLEDQSSTQQSLLKEHKDKVKTLEDRSSTQQSLLEELREKVKTLEDQSIAQQRLLSRAQQYMWAHDLAKLYVFYFSPCKWRIYTNKIGKLTQSLRELNLSEEELNLELEIKIKQFVVAKGMPEDFPVLTLQKISRSRTEIVYTFLTNPSEQREFIAKLSIDSFPSLPEDQRKAIAFLLRAFEGKPLDKYMTYY